MKFKKTNESQIDFQFKASLRGGFFCAVWQGRGGDAGAMRW